MNERREIELTMFATNNKAMFAKINDLVANNENFDIDKYVTQRYENNRNIMVLESNITADEINFVLHSIIDQVEMFGLSAEEIEEYEEDS